MKVKILDAHDRYQHFVRQDFSIAECCQDLIRQKPFGNNDFYIFAHARTDDDGVNKRLVWQPRLRKPEPCINSMLFRASPDSDIIEVIWIIPQKELWNQYKLGLMLENKEVLESIHKFENKRGELLADDPRDPTPEKAQQILFEYQPQLFKRETLPFEMRAIWDKKIAERKMNTAKI